MDKKDLAFEMSDKDHDIEQEIQGCKAYSCTEVALWMHQRGRKGDLSPLDFPLIDPVMGIGQEAEVILPCKASLVCMDAGRCVRLLEDVSQAGQEPMFASPKKYA